MCPSTLLARTFRQSSRNPFDVLMISSYSRSCLCRYKHRTENPEDNEIEEACTLFAVTVFLRNFGATMPDCRTALHSAHRMIQRLLSRVLPTAAGTFAAILALVTMSRSVGYVDSGELAAAATILGVPHPTGYPLMMIVSRLRVLSWLYCQRSGGSRPRTTRSTHCTAC